ncbi:MAG: glutathione S-transferase [Myxococcales bacterium]
MITVHHLEISRSQRVLWLLEELGLPYEIVGYRRTKRFLAPDSLKAVHPLGKSPVITDEGHTIAESGAIIEYVLGRYGAGRLAPVAAEVDARLRYTYWLHYAEGSLMPLLVMKLVLSKVPQKPTPLLLRPAAWLIVEGVERAWTRPQLALQLGFVENELGRTPWFAGSEFSAADIQMSMPLEAARTRVPLTREAHPRILDWLDRIKQRPAYQRAEARGGQALPARS